MPVSNLAALSAHDLVLLAPDDQVAKSARGLARPSHWQTLACTDRAIWGECKGSGASPYQVIIDLGSDAHPTNLAFKCSCPSHKHPCKHGLGLLLLAQATPDALYPAAPPPWVEKWLTDRAARAAGRSAKQPATVSPAPQPPAPVADTQAQTKRAQTRLQRVQQGCETLSLWLQDILHRGLGSLPGEPTSLWENQAARLVDAQAAGLARRLRDIAGIPAQGDGWPDHLLAAMARLDLLLQSFSNLETLPPDLQQEVRTQIGWTQEQATLLTQPGLRDHWLVLGQRVTNQDPLRVRTTWLWSDQQQQAALLLDMAAPGRSFEYNLIPGLCLDAELVFWPGASRQRALIKHQDAATPMQTLNGYASIQQALSAFGETLAVNPWLERFWMPLAQVTPQPWGSGWVVRDRQDDTLPLNLPAGQIWRLLALSGGHPITLMGEWNGDQITLWSVWAAPGPRQPPQLIPLESVVL